MMMIRLFFSLVFRVVHRYTNYNCYNDTMTTTTKSDNKKRKYQCDARTELYDTCDKYHHHTTLKKDTKIWENNISVLTSNIILIIRLYNTVDT